MDFCGFSSDIVRYFLRPKMPKKNKSKNLKRSGGGEDEQLPPKQNRVDDVPSPLCFDTPASLFRSLVQPLEPEVFFRDYWEKKVLHLQRTDSNTASYYRSLFCQGDLQGLCSQALEYSRDVNVVRCVNGKKKVLNKEGKVKPGDLTKFFGQNKATVQFHQPQRFKVRVAGTEVSSLQVKRHNYEITALHFTLIYLNYIH